MWSAKRVKEVSSGIKEADFVKTYIYTSEELNATLASVVDETAARNITAPLCSHIEAAGGGEERTPLSLLLAPFVALSLSLLSIFRYISRSLPFPGALSDASVRLCSRCRR